MMNKAAYAVLIALASYGSAFAGSNVCYGLVKVGRGWTTVVSDYGDYAPNGCRFRTISGETRCVPYFWPWACR